MAVVAGVDCPHADLLQRGLITRPAVGAVSRPMRSPSFPPIDAKKRPLDAWLRPRGGVGGPCPRQDLQDEDSTSPVRTSTPSGVTCPFKQLSSFWPVGRFGRRRLSRALL